MKRRSRQFRASVNRPNQTTSTQAKGKSRQIKANQGNLRQINFGESWRKLGERVSIEANQAGPLKAAKT
jgi:hypothetical protein